MVPIAYREVWRIFHRYSRMRKTIGKVDNCYFRHNGKPYLVELFLNTQRLIFKPLTFRDFIFKFRDFIFEFREVFREKFVSGRSPGDGPKFRENFLPPGDLAGLVLQQYPKCNRIKQCTILFIIIRRNLSK